MKKVLALLSCIAFVAVISLPTNAQEPEKKATKAKTEKACCSKEKAKKCPSACEKKAEEKTELEKVEKK
ncbi:MAG: hypothetical protein GQ564_04255 [Bacteroidales bacterium]|nr:hypothetical protein [Bacteroidales bacterium]